MPMFRKSKCKSKRSGVAAVEFAVCLPVIVLLVFGSIEASSFIFLKQALTVAAYEGARTASRPDGTNADAITRARAILNSRQVQGFNLRFPNGEASNADRGTEIVVIATASSSANSPLAGQFIADRQIPVRVVMLKE